MKKALGFYQENVAIIVPPSMMHDYTASYRSILKTQKNKIILSET